MKAMVFAAGLGTRLGKLTTNQPKALVEVGGEALLSIVLNRLREAGVLDVIINVHHHADLIEHFIDDSDGFGLNIKFSHEEVLLDTGGGLKNAAWFFDDGRPFLVHNVDVLSDIDLAAMIRAHVESSALATLAAKDRPTRRALLFDESGRLCGRVLDGENAFVSTPNGSVERLGFCGIHVISPELFARMTESGVFSIVETYLRLAGENADIRLHRADRNRWRDCGHPGDLVPL
jgi:NDP-sugar pyrophosphorylase family protein